jgi:hypothetical protein
MARQTAHILTPSRRASEIGQTAGAAGQESSRIIGQEPRRSPDDRLEVSLVVLGGRIFRQTAGALRGVISFFIVTQPPTTSPR